MTSLRNVSMSLLLLALLSQPCFGVSPETLAAQIMQSSLQVNHAVRVEKAVLHVGPATIELSDGTVFPATPVGDHPAEAVFIGKGAIKMSPSDDAEAAQLEVFTARRTLDEAFEEAVFVVGGDAMASIVAGSPAKDFSSSAAAVKVYDGWKSGSERRMLTIDSKILSAAIGDRNGTAFFAAHIQGVHLGTFEYVVDPSDRDMTLVGQFIAKDLTEREKRQLVRRLDREHRRGRMLGTDAADPAFFNVWTEAAGPVSADASVFEPERYRIDDTVADGAERIEGTASVDAVAVRGGSRVVPLRLHEDLKVTKVSDASGSPLFFMRSGSQLAIVLPTPPEAGQHISFAVEYSGVMFEKEGRSFRLRDTMYWYPHVGSIDRAKYEVTLHWPAGLVLLGPGKRVDGGAQWEKRILEIPSDGYTFEIGRFSIETIDAGHVKIRLAFDPESEDLRQVARSMQKDIGRNQEIDFRVRGITKQGRAEIREQLKDSLLFFENLFGPYPLDELTVVTVPRDFSQGLPGFVSLSTQMMSDPSAEFMDARTADVDRRLVVAHEVAHQWWGDLVSWSNWRDQWLNEAMATYAANEYSREKLDWRNRFQIGFTTRWPSMLLGYEHGARPIESLGPLAMGGRLSSSRAPGAYGWIVYQKGALVIETLARSIGEERFREILRDIASHESTKVLTTQSFLDYLARESGRDLRPFARYFIYGTGIPEIDYRYSVLKGEGGKWKIHLTGHRIDPWWYQIRTVKRDDGHFDVIRERVDAALAPLPSLIVPMQVPIDQPANSGAVLSYAKNNISISGKDFDLDVEIPWQPREVFLDRDREVPALFYCQDRNTKEVFLQRGTNLAAMGKLPEAEAAFKQGVAAGRSTEIEQALNRFAPVRLWMPVGVELGKSYKNPLLDIQNQLTNSALHLSLARLYIDEGKDPAAADELQQANRSLDRDWRKWIDDEAALLESRIQVRHGDYAGAFDRLSKSVLNGDNESAEACALLVIAARQSGHMEEFHRASTRAREFGVDLSAIQ